MGAGATTLSAATGAGLDEAQQADYAALGNSMLPASRIASETKEFAVRLKSSLCTPEGWNELQGLFREMGGGGATLWETAGVSSAEWGSIVYQDDGLRSKYFGDATPEEIAEQFDHLGGENDASAIGNLAWEGFVDGAISLGAAVELADALTTHEGEAELRELFETIEPDPDDGRTHISSSSSQQRLACSHTLSDSLSHCRYLAARVGPRAQGGALPVGAVHGPRRARLAAVHGLLPHRTCRYVDREDLSAARARCRQLCELGRVQGGWESDCGGLVGGAKLP